jgi:hypothetical protein
MYHHRGNGALTPTVAPEFDSNERVKCKPNVLLKGMRNGPRIV